MKIVAMAIIAMVGWAATARRGARVQRLETQLHNMSAREAAKSAFLRLAAHNLRTPLALARAYTEMVRTETFGPISTGTRDALKQAEIKLAELDEVVGRMIKAAPIQQGSRELRRES